MQQIEVCAAVSIPCAPAVKSVPRKTALHKGAWSASRFVNVFVIIWLLEASEVMGQPGLGHGCTHCSPDLDHNFYLKKQKEVSQVKVPG